MLTFEKGDSFIYCKNADGYCVTMIYRQLDGDYVGCNYSSIITSEDRREVAAHLDELNAKGGGAMNLLLAIMLFLLLVNLWAFAQGPDNNKWHFLNLGAIVVLILNIILELNKL
ncbi:MAG: hypothetical protein OEY89_12520 [Gammaproteobacteria bacterium]|nr:hypothetical protein [Gammaproteobacteria bacterium]